MRHAPLLLALALTACDPPPERVAAPIPVRVGEAAPVPDVQAATYTGSIRPRWSSDLGFRVPGKVLERLVEVGSPVRAGQPLARLDPSDLASALRSAEAELSGARAELASTRADLARYTKLARDGWSSAQRLEQARAAAEGAQARIERAEAGVQQARDNLSYAELHSGADGIVTALMAEAGQVVAAGQLVATVARLDEREAVVAVPETRMAGLAGAEATVTVWSGAGDGTPLPAQLREVSPVADPATRTYLARFSLPDAGEAVRLGMTASVRLRAPRAEPGVWLPASAVFQRDRQPAVWLLDGERLRLAPITVQSWRGEGVVAEGVQPGARIVTAGVHKLDENARVRVVEIRP